MIYTGQDSKTQPPPTQQQSSSRSLPPPPPAPPAYNEPNRYRAIPQAQPPYQQAPVQTAIVVVRPETAGRRFFRAFVVAVGIWLLLTMLVRTTVDLGRYGDWNGVSKGIICSASPASSRFLCRMTGSLKYRQEWKWIAASRASSGIPLFHFLTLLEYLLHIALKPISSSLFLPKLFSSSLVVSNWVELSKLKRRRINHTILPMSMWPCVTKTQDCLSVLKHACS